MLGHMAEINEIDVHFKTYYSAEKLLSTLTISIWHPSVDNI